MTKLILETDEVWIREKIEALVRSEAELMKRAIRNIRGKLQDFEGRYGKLDRESLYGHADDMELLEWEGEIETMERLQQKLKSFEEIVFEYK
jgi:hypothetical protein